MGGGRIVGWGGGRRVLDRLLDEGVGEDKEVV